jgi:hypothetical protein
MERDGLAAACVGVEAQRDLLGHRPAREPNRRLLAEQPGDAGLEPFGQLALAVAVARHVGPLGPRPQRRGRVALARAHPEREALARLPDLPPLFHARTLR